MIGPWRARRRLARPGAGRPRAGEHGAGEHGAGEHGAGERGERGAGSMLMLGILASVVLLTLVTVPLLGLLAVGQGVQNAADAAALAAADTVSGAVSGFPCEAADEAARLNGASVTACNVEGLIVTVSVNRDYLGFRISARARAGPPPGVPPIGPGARDGPHGPDRPPELSLERPLEYRAPG
ncbi:hypothetical protein E3T55_11500 [Cryobacterium frigoriphilum]|uniref:Helicase n=1 Tax=Cryobacterium frigoriphilum TaxID=1259150 RepID=A0A4V3IQY8_9MICO|nr:Rv3654c family TadE-like protein [Cryobacterium frigoriphilum]TFD49303.1 hypothetical protein E3T55_11500 [Cryobacterium frigoriphilum]